MTQIGDAEGAQRAQSEQSVRIEAVAAEAQTILERLCRQPSVAAQNHGMAEMATLVESLLRDAGFTTQRFTAPNTPDAPPAIYGELRGGPYTVLLYNHYDVQPAEPLDLWESPPFEPTIRDGKLYARGASDNKGEIAARLAAIHSLRAEHGELPITIRWIIEGEEEISSVHFDEIIAPHADLLKADGCFWEGSSFAHDGRPQLGLGSKGLLYVQLDVQGIGKDAHSGAAPVLPSAAWRLVQALATLKTPDGRVQIPGFYDAVREPTQQQIDALADQPDTDEQMRQTFGVERFVDDLHGVELRKRASFTPTCNIAGLLSGYTGQGSKTVLPAAAMAKIDFRLVPDQDPHDIAEQLRAHLNQQGYNDVRVTVLGAAEPVVTPIDEPFAQRIASLAEAFSGKKASITPLFGGTLPLLGSLRRRVGVPGLSVPGNPVYWGNGAHSPNEHIRLEDLRQAVAFNRYVFMELGKQG